jgi:hypothetical protein
MHITLRRCGSRPPDASRLWTFRWGFGIWLGRLLFTVGHDTRSRVVATENEDG